MFYRQHDHSGDGQIGGDPQGDERDQPADSCTIVRAASRIATSLYALLQRLTGIRSKVRARTCWIQRSMLKRPRYRSHPFNPVVTTPFMMYFCPRKNRMISGIV